jgi:hypothetical protein
LENVSLTLGLKVSELQIDDESMRLIVRSLSLEAHDFTLGSGIAGHSVDDQLPLVFGVIDSHLSNLLDAGDIATPDATSLAVVRIGFSDEGYGLLARAAKDRVADSVHGNRNVI